MYGGTNPLNTEWTLCRGQNLSSTVYPGVYSAIGTHFGGDANNFKLPNFIGRNPRGTGRGISLSFDYTLGEEGGLEVMFLVLDAPLLLFYRKFN